MVLDVGHVEPPRLAKLSRWLGSRRVQQEPFGSRGPEHLSKRLKTLFLGTLLGKQDHSCMCIAYLVLCPLSPPGPGGEHKCGALCTYCVLSCVQR